MSAPRSRRLGATAWTAIVAVIALASSLVALVFELRPDLRRDPRTRLGAQVSIFSVDPGVSYGRFLTDAAFSDEAARRSRRAACRGRPACGLLRIPGERVYVRIAVEGFKSRAIEIRLSLYDAATKRRIEGASNVTVGGRRLESPSDRAVVPVWLVCPPDPDRRYFVRVEILHRDEEVVLAVGDSERFRPRCEGGEV